MPNKIPSFDPTVSISGNILITIADGGKIQLFNESNVTISLKSTYGDEHILPAWFCGKFVFETGVTQLDWFQEFIIEGAGPSTPRIYGMNYRASETVEIDYEGPINRFIGISGGSIDALTTATSLMNIGNPALRSAIIRIINSGSLSDNFYVDNAGGITVRDQNGNILLQTHVAALPGSIEIGSLLSPVLISGLLTIAGMLNAGGIPYIDTSSHVVSDAAKLFWDAVNSRLSVGNNAPVANIESDILDAGTNNVVMEFLARHRTSAIPIAGFGSVFRFQAHTSTNANANQASIQTSWISPTNGAQTTRIQYFVYDTAAREYIRADATGATVNIGLLGASDFGSGARVIAIPNATTVPIANPVGGGVLYVTGGALHYRGSAGTDTVIAPA